MTDMQQAVTLVVGAIAIVAAIVGFFRWGLPKYRAARRTTRKVVATLVGTEEVRDPITNQLIRPAQPGVGVQVSDLRLAVTKLVEQQANTEALQGQVLDLDKRVSELEAARAERVVTQIESAEMWRAVANINETDHDPDDAA